MRCLPTTLPRFWSSMTPGRAHFHLSSRDSFNRGIGIRTIPPLKSVNKTMESSGHFNVVEKTIAEIHDAYRSGATDARAVTQAFLDRIEAYDRKGPALWAIIVANPDALRDADMLDREFAQTGTFKGPLHGIPVLVKDDYDVAGRPTTGGSASLTGWKPTCDATIVGRLRAAGAIIL